MACYCEYSCLLLFPPLPKGKKAKEQKKQEASAAAEKETQLFYCWSGGDAERNDKGNNDLLVSYFRSGLGINLKEMDPSDSKMLQDVGRQPIMFVVQASFNKENNSEQMLRRSNGLHPGLSRIDNSIPNGMQFQEIYDLRASRYELLEEAGANINILILVREDPLVKSDMTEPFVAPFDHNQISLTWIKRGDRQAEARKFLVQLFCYRNSALMGGPAEEALKERVHALTY